MQTRSPTLDEAFQIQHRVASPLEPTTASAGASRVGSGGGRPWTLQRHGPLSCELCLLAWKLFPAPVLCSCVVDYLLQRFFAFSGD